MLVIVLALVHTFSCSCSKKVVIINMSNSIITIFSKTIFLAILA